MSDPTPSPRMKIRCPNCRTDGSARAELINRRVTCKHCSHVFRVVPVSDEVLPPKVSDPRQVIPPGEPRVRSKDRIAALELEVGQLRADLSASRAEAAQVQGLRDQLDQFRDKSSPEGGDESHDQLQGEELKFLRDQLDKARAEVNSESRKRREAAASLATRGVEHARSLEELAAEHGRVLGSKEAEHAEVRDQLDRVKADAQAVEARRLAAESAKAEAEARHLDESQALRDEAERAQVELEGARKALEGVHAERDHHAADHSQIVGDLRGQLAALEARLGEVDTTRADRDRLAGELAEHQTRLADLDATRADRDRLAGELAEHQTRLADLDATRADRDRLAGELAEHQTRLADLDATRADRDRLAGELAEHQTRLADSARQAAELEAAHSAERAQLLEEREAAGAGQLDAQAILAERDEARARLEESAQELETLRARLEEAEEASGQWSEPGTEAHPSTNDVTETEIPAIRPDQVGLFDDGAADPHRAAHGDSNGVLAVDHDSASRLEAESLRAELEQVRAALEGVAQQNITMAERIRTLEAEEPAPPTVTYSAAAALAAAPAPAPDPAVIEAERKRAVDEAVKAAWFDFERRLTETQAKLTAANERANLMEAEARATREQATRASELGDGSSFDDAHSMTSIRILDARGIARLTPADAEARLALAKQLAVDRKDKPLIDRITKMADKVRADLEARNYTLAETLVRGAEIETGLDPGGFSIAGLRIFRSSPTVVGSLSALAPAFDRVMRQGDLASIESTIDEIKTLLGDQVGLPEIRRVGRTPAIKRPIGELEAFQLFVAALEAENWLMRPILAKKSPPDTSSTTYACLAEACTEARKVAERLAPDRLPLLDSVIQASCLMLIRRQQPDGHFSFLDPRGRASKPAKVVEAMVAQRPDAVKDGWVIHVDPAGMAQSETGICAVALATAGKALGRAEWSQAALKGADWAMGQPCLANFVANAASAGLLARAYLDAGQDAHLAGLAKKLTLGILPGQVDNGRWFDPSSAITPNHLVILRGLHDAWEAIPPSHDGLHDKLKPVIDLAMSSLLEESAALGVPPQGYALRDLLHHRDLTGLEPDPRLEAAILDTATVIQELCHEAGKPKLGVAPDQLAALTRLS